MQTLLGRASEIYAVTFFGVIIVVSLLECVVPRRAAADTLRLRWAGHLGLSILDAFLLRALFPVAGLGWALVCAQRGWGLFNHAAVPPWVAFGASIALLDLVAYLQHNALHRIPLLWTFHRAHHTDDAVDFTTGARFHPFESLFTTSVLMGAVALIGAPPAAVFVFEVVSMVLTFVEHGNIRVPARLSRVLQGVLVTPDMHRLHHSQEVPETNSNFGTVFPWWDRVFGTYRQHGMSPAGEPAAFGLPEFRERKHQSLPWILAQPFLHADRPGTATRSAEVPSKTIVETAGR